jgi:hypothetical protein
MAKERGPPNSYCNIPGLIQASIAHKAQSFVLAANPEDVSLTRSPAGTSHIAHPSAATDIPASSPVGAQQFPGSHAYWRFGSFCGMTDESRGRCPRETGHRHTLRILPPQVK